MSFQLPNGNDLTIEQLDIINLPTNEDWVITGGPGTGKTVMAVYRAAQLGRKKKILMIVYNKPLQQYIETAVRGSVYKNCEIKTYHQWVSDFYKSELPGHAVPKFDRFDLDWDTILEQCADVGKVYDHVIIDEAQDFPIKLIRLLKMVSKNITCFVDPDQSIDDDKTDTADMLMEMCVEAPYELTRNFRNTKPIRDVSTIFCNENNGDPVDSDIPGKLPVIIKCDDYSDMSEKMALIINQNKEKNIGVFVNNKNLKATYNALTGLVDKNINIEYYKTFSSPIDFDVDGVKILSYGTMKGLEFDMVLLPRIEKIKSTDDVYTDYNRLYVAVTRARSELYMFYFGTYIGDKWMDSMSPILNNRDLFEWRKG